MYPFAAAEVYSYRGEKGTLAEHLGFRADEKLLIINADDFGLTDDVNEAVGSLFEAELISSATIMVAAARYNDALERYRRGKELRCGIHLTLTSDLESSPARPIARPDLIPSLLTVSGTFWPSREEFFAHANPAEAEIEATAQIEKALADGIDVTHLDSHEGTLQLRPEFAEIYLRLAVKYQLPVRTGSRQLMQQVGMSPEWMDRFRNSGIHVPDNLVYLAIDAFDSLKQKSAYVLDLLDNLPAGVTELYFHPSVDGKAVTSQGNWYKRNWDYEILKSDEFAAGVEKNRLKILGYREIRNLIRR